MIAAMLHRGRVAEWGNFTIVALMMESWGDKRADMGMTDVSRVPVYTPY